MSAFIHETQVRCASLVRFTVTVNGIGTAPSSPPHFQASSFAVWPFVTFTLNQQQPVLTKKSSP